MFCSFFFYRLCFIVPRKDPRGQSIAAIHRELFIFIHLLVRLFHDDGFRDFHVFPDHSADGAVDSVVRRHDALCTALLNTSAERLEIQLILFRGQSKSSSSRGRPRCCSIEVFRLMHSADIWIVALHSLDVSAGHFPVSTGFSPVALLVSSPSRIALKINVGAHLLSPWP